jgi:hypothetical protein
MPEQPSEIARAIQDVTEKAQALVRDEVALAKAEVTAKATKLAKGAAAGAVAGVFALFALIYLLHALAWGLTSLIGSGAWLGYLIVAVLLLVIGGIAGFLAMRLVKGGAPPTPQMAIEEAQKIKGTIQAAQAAPRPTVPSATAVPDPTPAEGRR